MILASALAAIIPISIFLLIIWRLDKFDREPLGLYLKHFLWGAVGAVFFALIGNFLFTSILNFFTDDIFILETGSSVIIAPIVEEITKGVLLLFTISNRKFDNVTDGIVYGAAIGLGFGMTENFLYFASNAESMQSWIVLVIMRTVYTASLHCVATAIVGASLGFAKFKPILYKVILPPIGLMLAIFIHSFWNFSLSFSEISFLGIIFLTGLIILFFSLFSLSVSNDKKTILRELLDESRIGLIPEEHAVILGSELRMQKGWISETIRIQYIKKATELAFRKMQLRHSSGYNKVFYEDAVNKLRNDIDIILRDSNN